MIDNLASGMTLKEKVVTLVAYFKIANQENRIAAMENRKRAHLHSYLNGEQRLFKSGARRLHRDLNNERIRGN